MRLLQIIIFIISLAVYAQDQSVQQFDAPQDAIEAEDPPKVESQDDFIKQGYKQIKSCFYCREASMGYCAANEVDKIMASCPGFLPEKCRHQKNVFHNQTTSQQGLSQVTAHLGRAKTQLQCGDHTIAGCDQVDRGETEQSRIFLCCSQCHPTAAGLNSSRRVLVSSVSLVCLLIQVFF